MAEAEAEELEIHAGGHEHHHGGHDGTRFGKVVALSVSMIGVILAVVTISSHRAHTAAVIYRTDANDQWSYYQAKRMREYVADYALAVTPLVATSADPEKTQAVLKKYQDDSVKYKKESGDIEEEAHAAEKRSKIEEERALLLDTSEGFFELGLVLSSIYFLAKRKLFPWIGGLSAAVGAVFGVLGFLT